MQHTTSTFHMRIEWNLTHVIEIEKLKPTFGSLDVRLPAIIVAKLRIKCPDGTKTGNYVQNAAAEC